MHRLQDIDAAAPASEIAHASGNRWRSPKNGRKNSAEDHDYREYGYGSTLLLPMIQIAAG